MKQYLLITFLLKSTCSRKWCKWCAGGEIEQLKVQDFLKICLNYLKLWFSTKNNWWWPHVSNEFKDMKTKLNFKMIKEVKFTSKTIFNHLLLGIIFNDELWKSHLRIQSWALNTTIETSAMKNSLIQTTFCYYF